MNRFTFILIGILLTAKVYGQTNSPFNITVRDGNIDIQNFYLVTEDGNIELDSVELRKISPNWIKAVNVVNKIEDTDSLLSNSNTATGSIYIELKKKRLKQFLESSRMKEDDI